jgi:hypothetical protein
VGDVSQAKACDYYPATDAAAIKAGKKPLRQRQFQS